MRQTFLILTAMTAAGMFAAEPLHARPSSVKCAPTISVWVEVDGDSVASREPTSMESRKRVSFSLIGSAPYRGDAVLCSYATRRRDVTTSYSIRCLQPRQERGYKHSYTCR